MTDRGRVEKGVCVPDKPEPERGIRLEVVEPAAGVEVEFWVEGIIPYASSSSVAWRRTGLEDSEVVVDAPEVEAEVEEKFRRRGESVFEVVGAVGGVEVVVPDFGFGGFIEDRGSRILWATEAAEIGSAAVEAGLAVELTPSTWISSRASPSFSLSTGAMEGEAVYVIARLLCLLTTCGRLPSPTPFLRMEEVESLCDGERWGEYVGDDVFDRDIPRVFEPRRDGGFEIGDGGAGRVGVSDEIKEVAWLLERRDDVVDTGVCTAEAEVDWELSWFIEGIVMAGLSMVLVVTVSVEEWSGSWGSESPFAASMRGRKGGIIRIWLVVRPTARDGHNVVGWRSKRDANLGWTP
jgi:hypothetical protein